MQNVIQEIIEGELQWVCHEIDYIGVKCV